LEYQSPQPFKRQQPLWSPQPAPLWEPDSELHAFENPTLFAEDAETEFGRPKPQKAKAAEESSKQQDETKADGTKAAEKPQNPFGIEPDKLEQIVGSAQAPEEAKADALAQEVRNEAHAGDAQKPSIAPTPSTDPGPELPGLPKTGGTALPKDKKAQFERKVGNLDDVQVYRAPQHAKHLKAEAFTVGRRVYMGEGAGPDVLDHELGHFHPDDKKTKKIRRRAPDNSWVEKQAELRRQQAAERERQRRVAEAKRLAEAAAKRKADARARQRHDAAALKQRQASKAHSMAVIEQIRQKARHDRQLKAEKDPSTYQYRLKALTEKALRAKDRQRKAKLKQALKPFPGIRNILNFPPLRKGALALGKHIMNPAIAAPFLDGIVNFSQPKPNRKPKPAKNPFFEGARQVGGHLLDGVQSFSNSLLKPGVDLGHHFLNGADVFGLSLKASKLGQPKAQRFFEGALKQGQKLFKGASDFSNKRETQLAIAAGTISPLLGISLIPEAKKFTEAIPSWVDKHVDSLLKRRGAIAQTALKQIEHIPVLGKQAQAFAWFDNKACEFTGGVLKGAGSFVGGMANMVTHPIETASGLYTMAEHVPFTAGIMPNPLKLAHAGADILFNGADPRSRLKTVTDPVKSLEDDAKFGKALVTGFIEPYKKSWSEGKYFEVAGRAAFDVGSLFIGAGEANAAVKGGEIASVAGKTAEVTSVASKAEKVADATNVAEKATEAVNLADKAADVELAAKGGAQKKANALKSEKTKTNAQTNKQSKNQKRFSATEKIETETISAKTSANAVDKEKKIKAPQTSGLENRGYRPQTGERRTTKVEYKRQSSAERNFPGEQSYENCIPQSSQQMTRASTGKKLSEAEMEEIAWKTTDYDRNEGTTIRMAPNILHSQGVESGLYLNNAENIQIALDEGLGVMSHHDVRGLWGHEEFGSHAIHPIGLVRDAEGNVTHYIVNDTGLGYAGQKIPAKQFEDSLILHPNYPATFTDQPLSYGGRTASEARRLANQAALKGENKAGLGNASERSGTERSGAPQELSSAEKVQPVVVSLLQRKSLQALTKDEPQLERLLERVPDPLELKALLKHSNNPELLERMLTVTKAQKLSPASIQTLFKEHGPDVGKYLAQQSDTEIAAAFKATELEKADGGHSLNRHGPGLSNQTLEERLTKGITPDTKKIVNAPLASTRFSDYQAWVQTREAALNQIQNKYSIDLNKAPSSGQPNKYQVVVEYDRAIDEGFAGNGNKIKVSNPTTGKNSKVYPSVTPIDGITRTFSNVEWNGQRWNVVQHYPATEGWDNVLKSYDSNIQADFHVNLP
jgi:Domain of unknown function (DUF4157)